MTWGDPTYAYRMMGREVAEMMRKHWEDISRDWQAVDAVWQAELQQIDDFWRGDQWTEDQVVAMTEAESDLLQQKEDDSAALFRAMAAMR